MSRLHEEISLGKHREIESQLNELSIRIKLWKITVLDEEQQAKMIAARDRHAEPNWTEVAQMLDEAIQEMHSCREVMRKY